MGRVSSSRYDLIYSGSGPTPVGQVYHAGRIRNSAGIREQRVYGYYAIVYVTAGGGWFQEGASAPRRVLAGDLIIVFPDIPHTYGPGVGDRWDEVYVVFGGSVFELWRNRRVLDPANPMRRLLSTGRWLEQVQQTLAPSLFPTALEQVCAFQLLLARMLRSQPQPLEPSGQERLARARALLDGASSSPVDLQDVARQLGLSYDDFRKWFTRAVGISPGRYRSQRIMEAACRMLANTDQKQTRIAHALGFSDEHHFSRRFSQLMGQTPRQFRQHARRR
jgi:AraC-like DNA-binding protein